MSRRTTPLWLGVLAVLLGAAASISAALMLGPGASEIARFLAAGAGALGFAIPFALVVERLQSKKSKPEPSQ